MAAGDNTAPETSNRNADTTKREGKSESMRETQKQFRPHIQPVSSQNETKQRSRPLPFRRESSNVLDRVRHACRSLKFWEIRSSFMNAILLPSLADRAPTLPMLSRTPSVPSLVAFLLPMLAGGNALAQPSGSATDAQLAQQFARTIHPLVETYCLPCHGKEEPEGELDLSAFTSVDTVVAGFSYWELVLERLEAGDMPPDDAKQHPSVAQRETLVSWLHALRKNEAAKSAGDPGPVLARRLSNAEYDYTIHDLAGVDIRPTREFPVDPANQAGFDNSGESLAMSPALLKKYLDAGRTVAEHLVLKPNGFEFAPHPVVADTDRDKWGVLRIVDFYRRQPTDLADYFTAAWQHRHRAALGHGNASLQDTATRARISGRYLQTLWSALHDPTETVGPIAQLQARWHALPSPGTVSAEALRAQTEQMRNDVNELRGKIVPEVKNLTAPGIQNGSQTFVMWKNRQMAANRRTFDPSALQSPAAIAANAATSTRPSASPTPRPLTPPTSAKATPSTAYPASANAATASAKAPTQKSEAPFNPDVIRRGGKFLAPTIVTTGSSATFQMAATKNRRPDPDLFVPADPAERARYEAAFARFAALFPDAFYITERARVYMDAEKEQSNSGRLLSAGLHSMTGYFRDDGPLYDLILDQAGREELDRLWQDFEFASAVAIRMHTSFVWFERTDSSYMRDSEFDPYRPEDKSVTEPERVRQLAALYLAKARNTGADERAQAAIQEHFDIVAANLTRLEHERAAAVPSHLAALDQFAERAYRRPLTSDERAGLRTFYQHAREENGGDHEEAVRDCIVRVLMSPHFAYRIHLTDTGMSPVAAAPPPPATPSPLAGAVSTLSLPRATRPLSDYALASRLSYFLWSSLPDAELLAQAAAGKLRDPDVLAAQARRMLESPRIRNFATEFAGHWLDFRRFEEHNGVDRERFPSFDPVLRSAMFEEPLRFLVDLIQTEKSVLNCLHGDYTFVNAPLARHYGMPHPDLDSASNGDDTWVRVENAGTYGRGGLLPMAVFLTANSPGLRTSPVKRGYWVVRRILGERIPPPPANVPDLPTDEAKLDGLTLREALVRHRDDKACSSCHARFDSYGLVFEGYGATGERRTHDFAGQPVDPRGEFSGGRTFTGLSGLQDHIRREREADFTDNLARKLLAYALGRTLLLSDDALIEEMKSALAAHEYRFSALVDTVVRSPQFRTQRASGHSGLATLQTAASP